MGGAKLRVVEQFATRHGLTKRDELQDVRERQVDEFDTDERAEEPAAYPPPKAGRANVTTDRDGGFSLVGLPGPGHLLVNGPGSDHVFRAVGADRLEYGKGGGQRLHYHGVTALDLKPAAGPAAVTVKLRRGVTVRGRLLGPGDRPVGEAEVFCRALARFNTFRAVVHDGRFELSGLDPEERYPVFFLDLTLAAPAGPATRLLMPRNGR